MVSGNQDQSGRGNSKRLPVSALILPVAITIIVTAASCRRCPQIERLSADTVRDIRTVYVARLFSDSVTLRETVRDSVAPRLDSLGRVVGLDSWHWRERTRTDVSRSSDTVARTDTVWRDRVRTVTRVTSERKGFGWLETTLIFFALLVVVRCVRIVMGKIIEKSRSQ